ncbi:hypothetical protein TNIN_412111 [Trichonephila inaurata madagascariensis]|uniref:Uncharacterized protein n=1 Tax=Trichonephila inaurata madagascariensis TaxID=2747483 RepID=A0A8X6I6E2_9ARAC|nr:hypothetical protein TNIN_412111 [Trichonephila inaurata madagascariensis]
MHTSRSCSSVAEQTTIKKKKSSRIMKMGRVFSNRTRMTGGIQLEERTLQRPASSGLTGEEWTVPVKKNRSRVNPPFC